MGESGKVMVGAEEFLGLRDEGVGLTPTSIFIAIRSTKGVVLGRRRVNSKNKRERFDSSKIG